MVELCGWGARTTLLPSGISHGKPWGFSLAMTGDDPAELRWLVEPQAEAGGALGYWRAGMRLAEWIGAQPGASIESAPRRRGPVRPRRRRAVSRVVRL